MNNKAFIFDLDRVIVDTAKYHFLAWKKIANQLGINFTEEHNELLKELDDLKSKISDNYQKASGGYILTDGDNKTQFLNL